MHPEEEIVSHAIQRSWTFAAVDRLRRLLIAAALASVVWRVWRRLDISPDDRNPSSLRFFVGVCLLAAVATHAVLVLTLGEYRGWPNLILPSIAAVTAVLAIVMSVPPRRSQQ